MLAKLVEKTGSCVRDVELKKDGSLGSQHMYVMKGLAELLEVHGEIEGIQLMKAIQLMQATTRDLASKH